MDQFSAQTDSERTIMNKYLTEFIGTFFFVLTIGCCVVGGGGGIVHPLAVGASLVALVFAGGPVSGAHYNPAVTLAAWLRGRCESKDVIPYMGSQMVGALLAAIAVKFFFAGAKLAVIAPNVPRALLAEGLFTFALAYTVLNTTNAKGTAGNSFYGLAVGMMFMAGAFAVGNISGGAFNPAVAVGVATIGLTSWSSIWIYLVANFAGGALAALVFKFINPEDKQARLQP